MASHRTNPARRALALGALLLAGMAVGRAATPAGIFGDGMVLQRNARVCVFGTGRPGEAVEVAFAGQAARAVADQHGRWEAFLAPMAATAEPRALRIHASNTVVIHNVVVGDVWLAGGQSNMGSRMREYLDTVASEIPKANHPLLRFFTVEKRKVASDPASSGDWSAITPDTVLDASATAYFFGRDLQRHLKIPVGIVVCAWGGTLAENWISRETLLSHPETRPIVERYDRIAAAYGSEANYRAKLGQHQKALSVWKQKRKSGQKGIPAPKEPMGREHFQRPAGLYETMFRTITPFTFKGIIFYQGESNIVDGRSFQYRYLLPMLVSEWRRDLRANLPFLNVQLPVIKGQHEDDWAELRESQVVAGHQLDGYELAVVLEFGDLNKLHPPRKEEVGARLALLARGAVYGEPIVCRGPALKAHRIAGNRVFLTFDQVGGGLVARGGELKDFTVSDATGKFVPANARIVDHDTVEVSSADVSQPVAVRYGWKNYFEPTLFNREGFSASGFRTDTFKLKSQDKR